MIVEIIQKIQLLNLDHGLDLYIGEKIMKRIICRIFGHKYNLPVWSFTVSFGGKVYETYTKVCKKCGYIKTDKIINKVQ